MAAHLTILLIGFTLFSAISLLIAYVFFLPNLEKNFLSKLACAVLLLGLSSLQCFHYWTLTTEFNALDNRFYLVCLLFVPASFYYFSRFVLFPGLNPKLIHALHLIPALIGLTLPLAIIPPIAFLLGSAYCLWFVHLVLKLRSQQNRFAMERFFFSMFALMAVGALILGLMIPYIDTTIFYIAYSSAIGLAMFLVTTAIIVFPEMLDDLQQIAGLAYANSKLTDVNISVKKHELEKLIQQERVYQDEKLSLKSMAAMLDLSIHQLSELVNTQYGYGFSQFVRKYRVEQAKKLLLEEPDTSILAISIMTGFQSQSNFYAAFKEITKLSPGNYRKSKIAR